MQIIVSIALLWRILGVASLGGLAVMIGTSPLQVIFGKILASMTKEIMMKKDSRIKLTNEVWYCFSFLFGQDDDNKNGYLTFAK